MSTQLQMVNLAMDELGEGVIGAIADTSDRGLCASRQWSRTLRAFLREYPWPWARTTDTLTAASTAPAFGWAARYPLPDDFIALVTLNQTEQWYPSDVWEIMGGYLFTDSDTAEIEYVYEPTSTGLDAFCGAFDPKAEEAFILLLAANMAPKIVKDGGTRKMELLGLYQRALARAVVIGGTQKDFRQEPATESAWNRARYGDQQG